MGRKYQLRYKADWMYIGHADYYTDSLWMFIKALIKWRRRKITITIRCKPKDR